MVFFNVREDVCSRIYICPFTKGSMFQVSIPFSSVLAQLLTQRIVINCTKHKKVNRSCKKVFFAVRGLPFPVNNSSLSLCDCVKSLGSGHGGCLPLALSIESFETPRERYTVVIVESMNVG